VTRDEGQANSPAIARSAYGIVEYYKNRMAVFIKKDTTMKQFIVFRFLILLFFCASINAQDCDNKIIIGERVNIHSSVFKQTRSITVHLPLGYNPQKRYPVLYMLDGLAQFGIGVSFSGMSYVGTIPELIVVAVDCQNREKEYTPTHVEGFQDSGGSDQFVDFIKKELFPYVDSAYSTMPFRILSGHSLAGILVIDLLLSEPDLFNAYIAMDPSLWWDNHFILNKTAYLKEDNPNLRCLYLSSTNSNQKVIIQFDSALNVKPIKGLKYKYKHFKDEAHADVVFVGLYYGLRYIFADYAITDDQKDSVTMGEQPEFIKEHYSDFSKQAGVDFFPPENVITRLGMRSLYDDKDFANAITIFEILKGYYPESFEIYNYLGEAYLNNGDKKSALLNYRKSYELNPKDEKMKSKINEIENGF
jgi:uncharacterized protein